MATHTEDEAISPDEPDGVVDERNVDPMKPLTTIIGVDGVYIKMEKIAEDSGTKFHRKKEDLKQAGISKFISETFMKKECNRFRFAATKKRIDFCKCGYSKKVHSFEAQKESNHSAEYQSEFNQAEQFMTAVPTDAFGTLDYVDEEEEGSNWKNIRYVRLNDETPATKISMLLLQKWKMEKPYVIFSIISDNDRFMDNEVESTDPPSVQKTKKNICSNLLQAVASTKAWIITGGLDSGVDELIGNEVKRRLANDENRNMRAVIGISNWGSLEKKKDLLNTFDSISPSGYATDRNLTGSSLNPHHTHFLLVDDGTQNRQGCERKLRRKVELELSKKKKNEAKTKNDLSFPLIYILIGGSYSALNTVKHALTNETPVLIATGTGGAADAISKEFWPKGDSVRESQPKVSEKLKKIRALYRGDLLVDFQVTGDQKKSIKSLIADALKKAKEDNPIDVYMLFADWDDEAFFKHLLKDNWKDQYHPRVLRELLKRNKNKYAELVLAHNRKSKWLTEERSPLAYFPEEVSSTLKKNSAEGASVALKEFYPLEDSSTLKNPSKMNKTWNRFQKKIKELPAYKNNKKKRSSLEGKMLFTWCIQNRMPETAMLFWKRGQDCLATLLLAYRISKTQKKNLVDKEGYDEMVVQLEFFAERAINFLKKCYADNHKNTHVLLVGRVKDLKETPTTPLKIAVKAKFTTFVSLVPIQDLLNEIWVKDIKDYDKYKYIPMLLSTVCPLLAPVMFKFQKHVYDEAEDETPNSPLSDADGDTSNPSTAKQWYDKTKPMQKPMKGYFKRFMSFIDTPLVKFTYGMISYIGYLLLFSVVMLTDFRRQMGLREMVLSCWTGVLLIEEAKQAIDQKKAYVSLYNFFDIAAQMLYVTGFTLRMIYSYDPTVCPTCLYVARIILAFSLLIFFIRSLQFLWVFNNIGPKIYMMRRLIRDLVSFLLIMIVFIAGYGVVSNIIMYPNQPLNIDLLHDVFYDACWSVLQQFNREETSGSQCKKEIVDPNYCSSMSDENIDYVFCKENHCPANDWLVSIILAFYALFTGIMLLNVLIAMFNATFTTITENERGVSKLQRYRLIREYSYQSMIPTPLCVITYPYYVLNKMYTEIRRYQARSEEDESHQKISKSLNTPFERFLTHTVKSWEHDMVLEYLKPVEEKKGEEKKGTK